MIGVYEVVASDRSCYDSKVEHVLDMADERRMGFQKDATMSLIYTLGRRELAKLGQS
jgi:hypothetical protein